MSQLNQLASTGHSPPFNIMYCPSVLEVATATGCKGEKGSYMRIPNPDMNTVLMLRASYCQKHSECVWANIIEQAGVNSECLLEACLPAS